MCGVCVFFCSREAWIFTHQIFFYSLLLFLLWSVCSFSPSPRVKRREIGMPQATGSFASAISLLVSLLRSCFLILHSYISSLGSFTAYIKTFVDFLYDYVSTMLSGSGATSYASSSDGDPMSMRGKKITLESGCSVAVGGLIGEGGFSYVSSFPLLLCCSAALLLCSSASAPHTTALSRASRAFVSANLLIFKSAESPLSRFSC